MATLTPHTDDLSEFEGLFMRRALFAGLSAVALTFTSTAVASGQETLGELSATTQSSEGEPSRADGIADEAIEELPEGLTLGSQGMQMMSSEDADAGQVVEGSAYVLADYFVGVALLAVIGAIMYQISVALPYDIYLPVW